MLAANPGVTPGSVDVGHPLVLLPGLDGSGRLFDAFLGHVRRTRDAPIGHACVASVRDTGANVKMYDIDAPHLVLQRAPAEAWLAVAAFIDSLPGGRS